MYMLPTCILAYPLNQTQPKLPENAIVDLAFYSEVSLFYPEMILFNSQIKIWAAVQCSVLKMDL